MNIYLTPQLRQNPILLSKSGDILTINGTHYDFSDLQEGEVLPVAAFDTDLIAGNVTRKDGHINILLVLPHGSTARDDAKFPSPLLDVQDGDIDLPAFSSEDI